MMLSCSVCGKDFSSSSITDDQCPFCHRHLKEEMERKIFEIIDDLEKCSGSWEESNSLKNNIKLTFLKREDYYFLIPHNDRAMWYLEIQAFKRANINPVLYNDYIDPTWRQHIYKKYTGKDVFVPGTCSEKHGYATLFDGLMYSSVAVGPHTHKIIDMLEYFEWLAEISRCNVSKSIPPPIKRKKKSWKGMVRNPEIPRIAECFTWGHEGDLEIVVSLLSEPPLGSFFVMTNGLLSSVLRGNKELAHTMLNDSMLNDSISGIDEFGEYIYSIDKKIVGKYLILGNAIYFFVYNSPSDFVLPVTLDGDRIVEKKKFPPNISKIRRKKRSWKGVVRNPDSDSSMYYVEFEVSYDDDGYIAQKKFDLLTEKCKTWSSLFEPITQKAIGEFIYPSKLRFRFISKKWNLRDKLSFAETLEKIIKPYDILHLKTWKQVYFKSIKTDDYDESTDENEKWKIILSGKYADVETAEHSKNKLYEFCHSNKNDLDTISISEEEKGIHRGTWRVDGLISGNKNIKKNVVDVLEKISDNVIDPYVTGFQLIDDIIAHYIEKKNKPPKITRKKKSWKGVVRNPKYSPTTWRKTTVGKCTFVDGRFYCEIDSSKICENSVFTFGAETLGDIKNGDEIKIKNYYDLDNDYRNYMKTHGAEIVNSYYGEKVGKCVILDHHHHNSELAFILDNTEYTTRYLNFVLPAELREQKFIYDTKKVYDKKPIQLSRKKRSWKGTVRN